MHYVCTAYNRQLFFVQLMLSTFSFIIFSWNSILQFEQIKLMSRTFTFLSSFLPSRYVFIAWDFSRFSTTYGFLSMSGVCVSYSVCVCVCFYVLPILYSSFWRQTCTNDRMNSSMNNREICFNILLCKCSLYSLKTNGDRQANVYMRKTRCGMKSADDRVIP